MIRLLQTLHISVLLLLTACVVDEISIGFFPNGIEPLFTFEYAKDKSHPTVITDLIIKEADSGRIIWQLSAFDLSRFTHSTLPHEAFREVKPAIVRHLKFGQVPDGLKQFFPVDEPPTFTKNVRYVIEVSGGTSGKREFVIDQ